jgi:hypothetical protein
MGFDLALVTKDEIPDARGGRSRFHYLVDRGFCTFILNAKNHSPDLMEEAEKALRLDLQFLLIPEYYDPKSFSEENLREMGLTEDQIKETYTQPIEGFVKIEPFLEKLKQLQNRFTKIPDYESNMNYDRAWWQNYFADDFRKDIKNLIQFLEFAQQQGQEEFAFMGC